MSDRPVRNLRNLKAFESFPEEAVCPICKTNDDGQTLLLAIDGTGDGRIAAVKASHVACALATNINLSVGVIYRRIGQ